MEREGRDDESVVGDMAHIVGRDDDSRAARVPARLTPEEREQYAGLIGSRNEYVNLILLCKVHHKLVDDQPNSYPVSRLLEIKAGHEQWVRESLSGFDFAKQQDDEVYAEYLDHWIHAAHLENWMGWTSFVFGSGQPSLDYEINRELKDLNRWLLGRVWPQRYPTLEDAFRRFRWILDDFLIKFHEHSQQCGSTYWTEKIYQRAYGANYDPDRLQHLAEEYDKHVAIVVDLGLELTRAANRICDEVRRHIDPTFWIREGRLLVQEGPDEHLMWHEYVAQYAQGEIYEGLEEFKESRAARYRRVVEDARAGL